MQKRQNTKKHSANKTALGRQITNTTNYKKSKYKMLQNTKVLNTNLTKCKKTKHKCDIIPKDKIQI